MLKKDNAIPLANEVEYSQNMWGYKWSDAIVNKLKEREIQFDPYRRFTWILGIVILLFAVVLISVSFWYISDFIQEDTVQLTRSAVDIHFQLMFTELFANGEMDTDTGYGSGTSSDDYGYSNGNDSVGSSSSDDDFYQATYNLIRMHFDLYAIQDTHVYSLEGDTVFSYDQAHIGQDVPAQKRDDFQLALSGESVVNNVGGDMLNLWVPMVDGSGQRSGVVEIARDVSSQNSQMRQFQTIMIAAIIGGLLILFFALRGIYKRSTRTIDEKNEALLELVNAIENTYNESLQALSSALDSRDHVTRGIRSE